MEFAGISAQRARLRSSIEARMAAVLDHGQFIRGPEVLELESRLAAFADVPHCITCANGTDALQIALMALGIGPGDEVVVPAFSFFASVEAVLLAGALPVFADIDPASFNIDPGSVAAVLTSRTRAVMPVSLFGQCAEIEALQALTTGRGIALIEDGAQSFGANRNGRRSCALTTLACTSFFPSKPLGCYGDGGALFTTDPGLAARCTSIAQHGQRERYLHERLGMNSRLDTLQAAVLLAKLEVFEDEIASRARVAAWYAEELASAPGVRAPALAPGNGSAWAQYTVRLTDRDRVAKELNGQGIPTTVHYPLPLHRQPACRRELSLPHAERAAAEVLSLPMHAYLRRDEVARVCDALRRATGH